MISLWLKYPLPPFYSQNVKGSLLKFTPRAHQGRRKVRECSCYTRVAKEPKSHVVSFELEEPPQGVVSIKAYGNTNFANIMLERPFYKQLEETAKKLETTPEKLIYNAILLILKSLNVT